MLEVNSAANDPRSAGLLRGDRNAVAAGRVAKVVAGIRAIGQACEALRVANFRVSVAGNRITIDDDFFAVLIGATAEPDDGADARWVIYPVVGGPPVWVVSADRAHRDGPEPPARAPLEAAPIGRLQLAGRGMLGGSMPRTHVRERRWV
jgi:hypothetical protein